MQCDVIYSKLIRLYTYIHMQIYIYTFLRNEYMNSYTHMYNTYFWAILKRGGISQDLPTQFHELLGVDYLAIVEGIISQLLGVISNS